MADPSSESRFPLKDRWKIFCFAIIPLAIMWGILFTIVGYLNPKPGGWHPIVLGLAIAGMFAGLLAVVFWAAGSRPRILVLFAASSAYYGYRHDWGRWWLTANIIVVLYMLFITLWRRERS